MPKFPRITQVKLLKEKKYSKGKKQKQNKNNTIHLMRSHDIDRQKQLSSGFSWMFYSVASVIYFEFVLQWKIQEGLWKGHDGKQNIEVSIVKWNAKKFHWHIF